MIKLVLLRHGQSQWNLENRFTGWTDVPLSEKGIIEAQEAGKKLKEAGFEFDMAYTSVLKRAIKTLWLCLEELDQMYVPTVKNWRLNERHYGALQGLNKSETAQKHGEEQVHIWRRSYDTPPPALKSDDPRNPANEGKYSELNKNEIPLCESLEDTVKRFLPYWKEQIKPMIKTGAKVLISAHGNSLRALVKHLDQISNKEISQLNIPTGIPLVYELDEKDLTPLNHYYLGDETELKEEMQKVAQQGSSK